MLCSDVSKAVSCVLCGEKLEIGDWRLGEEPAGGEAGSDDEEGRLWHFCGEESRQKLREIFDFSLTYNLVRR